MKIGCRTISPSGRPRAEASAGAGFCSVRTAIRATDTRLRAETARNEPAKSTGASRSFDQTDRLGASSAATMPPVMTVETARPRRSGAA